MLAKSSSLKTSALAFVLVAFVSGCGKGTDKNPKIDGIEGPTVSFVDNKFLMNTVFTKLQLPVSGRIPVPHMPGSYLEIGPDFQSYGTLLTAALDIRDVQKLAKDQFRLLDPLVLPGGRPLPGVVEGYLPAIAVQVPKLHNVVFYFGPEVLGAFVPVDLPFDDVVMTYRFHDAAGERVGNISVIGKDSSKANSGFLVLVDIKGKVKTLLNTGLH
jgi:hypothetical protein